MPRYYIDNLCNSNAGSRGAVRRADVVSCGGDQRPPAATVLLTLRLHVPPSLVAHVQDLLDVRPPGGGPGGAARGLAGARR